MLYNDWFLPSKYEWGEILVEIYNYSLGNFDQSAEYWTSTEETSTLAWSYYFPYSSTHVASKSDTFNVRAIRSFIGDVGEYAIRDIGPAGGYIFAYVSGRYYECAPFDQSTSQSWSNVSNLIGTTGDGIGTGQDNTNDIIAQVGHTTSAAKLCDDLEINYSVTTTIVPTTTLLPTTTYPPQRGITISHENSGRVTSMDLIPFVKFSINPGIGSCYEFMDMFIKSTYKPDNIVVSTNSNFTDYAIIPANKIIEYNTGWYNIKRLPRTIGGKVLIGKVLFVKINYADHSLFYDLKLVSTGYKEVTGF
jgi:hypothetical protein